MHFFLALLVFIALQVLNLKLPVLLLVLFMDASSTFSRGDGKIVYEIVDNICICGLSM